MPTLIIGLVGLLIIFGLAIFALSNESTFDPYESEFEEDDETPNY